LGHWAAPTAFAYAFAKKTAGVNVNQKYMLNKRQDKN
jgi:hypothetical protein